MWTVNNVFNDVLWTNYNRKTKSTQFNCPTLAASFNAFLFTRKIWAWPQQCFQTIFHLTAEKADAAVLFWDSGHQYRQLKHSKFFFFQPAWFFGAQLIFSSNIGRPRRVGCSASSYINLFSLFIQQEVTTLHTNSLASRTQEWPYSFFASHTEVQHA